ncbi:MAG: coiled-coil domain-containing protein 22 [Chloroflexota bacterium]
MNKYILIILGLMMAACGRITAATNTPALPFTALTPLVETAQPFLEMQAQIDGLIADVDGLEAEVARLEAEIAQRDVEIAAFQAEATQNAITPTATIRPTSAATSTPNNVMTVTAKDKLNLRYYKKSNASGYPIMLIYEPRVQYFTGDTFQVLKPVIRADGGDLYYQVVGPRGAGLFVRTTDVTTP